MEGEGGTADGGLGAGHRENVMHTYYTVSLAGAGDTLIGRIGDIAMPSCCECGRCITREEEIATAPPKMQHLRVTELDTINVSGDGR